MYIEGADENLFQQKGSHSEPTHQGSRRMNLHIYGLLVYNIALYNGVQFTYSEHSLFHTQGRFLQRRLTAKYKHI